MDTQEIHSLWFLALKLGVGGGLISLTVIIHAVVYDIVLRMLPVLVPRLARLFGAVSKIPVLIFAVGTICCALMIDIWLWTFLFRAIDPERMGDIETALYFATTSFTTVGYGDVVLSTPWRLLGSIAALNGMIVIGWSTAFVFEVMAKLYDGAHIKKRW